MHDNRTSFCPNQREQHNSRNVHGLAMPDAHDSHVLNDKWVSVDSFGEDESPSPEKERLFEVRYRRLELELFVGFSDTIRGSLPTITSCSPLVVPGL